MTTATNAQLDLSPAPAAASRPSMIWAQSQFELRLMLRNGEQILLTLIIPLFLLVGLTSVGWVELGSGARIDIVTPGIFALAIMSTAFTAQAISVGFDRRYGVLKLLGSTPLSRTGLVASKTLAVLAVEVIQIALISSVAFVLGWDPQGNPAAAVLLMIFGTAAFALWDWHWPACSVPRRRSLSPTASTSFCCSPVARSSPRKSSRVGLRAPRNCSHPARSATGCATCCSTVQLCRWDHCSCWLPGSCSG